MKKLLFYTLMACVLPAAFGQQGKYNIVFENEQTTLSDSQKQQIDFVASGLSLGERVIFYPLIYDTYYDVYKFNGNAKTQATSIAAYAATIGFELEGMPRNFPSSFSGMSYGVVMRYTKPTVKETNPIGISRGMMDHFPEKPSQFFEIDPLRDTIIEGNEGTLLYFKAGCLLSKKKIQIELKEFYGLDDYIKNGLPTISNGQMIQTGGSMYLNAKEKESGTQVKINPNQGVGVDFTLGKNDTAMQVFIKDPRYPNSVNWILPSKRIVKESWQMTETVTDAKGKILSEKTYTKEEWEQHVKDEEQKAKEKKKKEAIAKATNEKMDAKLQVYNLGYINCDKFYGKPTIPLMVKGDENLDAEYYLVYTDIRGVMKASVVGKQVSFTSVAKDQQAILIGVCFIDKQAYFFRGTVEPGGKLKEKIVLAPVEEAYLNTQLALLK